MMMLRYTGLFCAVALFSSVHASQKKLKQLTDHTEQERNMMDLVNRALRYAGSVRYSGIGDVSLFPAGQDQQQADPVIMEPAEREDSLSYSLTPMMQPQPRQGALTLGPRQECNKSKTPLWNLLGPKIMEHIREQNRTNRARAASHGHAESAPAAPSKGYALNTDEEQKAPESARVRAIRRLRRNGDRFELKKGQDQLLAETDFISRTRTAGTQNAYGKFYPTLGSTVSGDQGDMPAAPAQGPRIVRRDAQTPGASSESSTYDSRGNPLRRRLARLTARFGQ